MINTLVFVSIFCVVAVLVYMGRYSGRIRVEQTRLIDAPLNRVYAQVADLGQWQAWIPWLEHEPEALLALSAPADAADSSCSWSGAKAGEGRIVHKRLVAMERIEQNVRLKHPFTVAGRAVWTFTDRGGKTEVTWSLRARVAFSMRAFAATVNGALAFDLRYGLDRLARTLEPDSAPRYAVHYLGVREVDACRYVYRTYSGPINGLPEATRNAFAELKQQLDASAIAPAGRALALYVKTNIKLRTTVCHLGVPVGDVDVGALPVRELSKHRAFVVRLVGGYGALELAWYLAMQRMTLEAIRPDQRLAPFESYLVSSDTSAESGYVTELYIPVVTN